MFDREINQLVNAIKNTSEYRETELARKAIDKNKTLRKQLEDYINNQKKLQTRYKDEQLKTKLNSLNQSYEAIFNHPDVVNYNKSSYLLNTMINNVYIEMEKNLIK